MLRHLCVMAVLVAPLTAAFQEAPAQNVAATAAIDIETPFEGAQNLAFSKDGHILREVQSVPPQGLGIPYIHATSYDAATGKIVRVLDFADDTAFFSLTTDGRIAILSVDRDREPPSRVHLVRADMDTGRTEELPREWFDADDYNPWAQISGDGRLVSAFSERGPEIVTVYNWRTKELVTRQSADHHAAGFDSGGVSPDGKIAFSNNRSGTDIFDPKTHKRLVSYNSRSFRSPDGVWILQFPDLNFGPEIRIPPILNATNGQILGELDIHLTDAEEAWWWSGAFCGASGRFIAVGPNEILAFEIPSGKKLQSFPPSTWSGQDAKSAYVSVVACSPSGHRVAIRNGFRLTLHDLI